MKESNARANVRGKIFFRLRVWVHCAKAGSKSIQFFWWIVSWLFSFFLDCNDTADAWIEGLIEPIDPSALLLVGRCRWQIFLRNPDIGACRLTDCAPPLLESNLGNPYHSSAPSIVWPLHVLSYCKDEYKTLANPASLCCRHDHALWLFAFLFQHTNHLLFWLRNLSCSSSSLRSGPSTVVTVGSTLR